MLKITLSNKDKSFTVQLSKELRSLSVFNVLATSDELWQNAVELTIKYDNNSTDKMTLNSNITNFRKYVNPDNWYEKGLLSQDKTALSVTAELLNKLPEDKTIEILFSTQNYFSIDNPFQSFKSHLSENDNLKILFSAPFGQGKTTFLKFFFDEQKSKYNAFHIFPVNYSVSQNKDIFEYIKCEILFKLLEREDIEFDKESFSYLQTLPDFIKNNGGKIISPFLRLIPNIGKSIDTIAKNINSMATEYFEYHKKVQKDDALETLDYVRHFFETEGSIYEDNFHTQLIRHHLKQLKSNSKKENVLIIDDLDRLDPDHVFRILNIFAAHFDSELNYEDSNKFGFDKIMVVCDYNNLHKIFNHKFGDTTDFSGYINKFFSKTIYEYDNVSAAESIIEQYLEKNSIRNYQVPRTVSVILRDLFTTQSLTLRELIKFSDIRYTEGLRENINITSQNHITLLKHLCKLFNPETLTNKIERCRNTVADLRLKSDINYDILTKDALIELNSNELQDNSNSVVFSFNNRGFKLKVENNRDTCRTDLKKFKQIFSTDNALNPKEHTPVEFSAQDFYLAIINIIDKYTFKILSNKPA